MELYQNVSWTPIGVQWAPIITASNIGNVKIL